MRLFRKKTASRMLVIGLDGFPYSLLRDCLEKGIMPFLSKIMALKPPLRMTSVYPTISSVAWATFATGRNPASHGLFGFVDRKTSPMMLTLPNRNDLKSPQIWTRLGEAGYPVCVVNVPVTYPPIPVNGTLVSCFLGIDPAKSVTPLSNRKVLERHQYIIDADTSIAQSGDYEGFISHLTDVLSRRCHTFLELCDQTPWRYAHLHIMETDRLFHFFWHKVNRDNRIETFFRAIDTWIQTFFEMLSEQDECLLLSDHGFCPAEHEIQVNQVLADAGFYHRVKNSKGINAVSPDSLAYSLIPGRVYVNLKGREPEGCVDREHKSETLDRLESAISDLTIPGTSRKIFQALYRREEIYRGDYLEDAADLFLIPEPGMELKGKFEETTAYSKPSLSGMHTYHDAFVWSMQGAMARESEAFVPNIIDLYPTILDYFNVCDPGAEGRIFLKW